LMPDVESEGVTDSFLCMERIAPNSNRVSLTKAVELRRAIFRHRKSRLFDTLKSSHALGTFYQETDSRTSSPLPSLMKLSSNNTSTSHPVVIHCVCRFTCSWTEIVGVVSDFSQRTPEEDSASRLLSHLAMVPRQWSLVIRMLAAADFSSSSQMLKTAWRNRSPALLAIRTMQKEIHDSESLRPAPPIVTLRLLSADWRSSWRSSAFSA